MKQKTLYAGLAAVMIGTGAAYYLSKGSETPARGSITFENIRYFENPEKKPLCVYYRNRTLWSFSKAGLSLVARINMEDGIKEIKEYDGSFTRVIGYNDLIFESGQNRSIDRHVYRETFDIPEGKGRFFFHRPLFVIFKKTV